MIEGEYLPLDDYDWNELFRPGEWAHAVPFTSGPAPLARKLEDVRVVHHLYTISPEGWGSHEIIALVEFEDGAWGLCEAWADTTGWGCQDGVEWRVGTEADVQRLITPDQAEKLGLS